MTIMTNKIKILSILFLLLTACNNNHLTVDRPLKVVKQGDENAPVTFYRDIQPLFTKACSNCHGQGSPLGDWSNYDAILAKKDRIMERVVIKKDMPLGATMPDAERELVFQWLQLGAPTGTASARPQ